MFYTGCRISEALRLTPRRVDLSGNVLIFETLKKRKDGIFRAVPVPPDFLDTLNMEHDIKIIQSRPKSPRVDKPLWELSRTTAWRRIKELMVNSGINEGPHLCPKGLRHGYGVEAISKGIPLNMLQKWMGHVKMETTAIYANAVGDEQHDIASRMWT